MSYKRNTRYSRDPQNLLCLLFILTVLLFHGFCNYRILSASRFNFAHDQALFYTDSVRFFYALKENIGPEKLWELYTSLGNHYRPPLFIIISGIFYFIFGFSKITAIMLNLFYLAILLFATYGIGKRMYNAQTGVLACFLVSMFPAVFGYSRVFYSDFPLSALIALSVYLYLLSDNFADLKYSLFLGLNFGLGLLTKESFIIYILPLLIYPLPHTVRSKVRLRNFSLSLFLGLALASSWYIPNWSTISYKFPLFIHIIMGYGQWYAYINLLYTYQLLLPLFMLFLAACIFFIVKKDFFLPALVIIPLFILSLFPNKFPRFDLPLFVPMALMIAHLIYSLDRTQYKLLSVTTCIFSFAQFFLICFIPNSFSYLRPLLTWEHPVNNIGIYHAVDKGYWQTNEIWKTIASDVVDIKQNKTILVIPNISNLHGPLQTHSTIMKSHLHFYCPAEQDPSVIVSNDYEWLILSTDYIIDKSGEHGFAWREKYIGNLQKAFSKYKDRFSIMKEFPLPDNSTLYIYKKKLIS